ncbi:MAG: 7,8-didemethyl-8-hydroxy-5-deazariboflavin synthase subunit CofH, partial [Candidatus Hydrothermarchaeales archaeon]
MFEDLISADPEIEGVLGKVLDGRRISDEKALALISGDSFFPIALVANEMRRRRVGEVVTYVVNRNIN